MSFTLSVDGVLPLLQEDGATDLMTEDGQNMLTLEGGYDTSTSQLLYGSVTLKLNTLDFAYLDLAAPAVGAAVTTTNPTWVGTVAAATSSDPSLQGDGHQVVNVTATNTAALPSGTAQFDLSDVPVAAASGDYLLEDGSGHYLIESGTDFSPGALLLEQALSYGYSNLTVRKQSGAPPTTLAICTVQQPGLRPGDTVHLTSQNQGYAAYALQINQATLQWHGVPLVPQYLVEMGDTPSTLALWTQLNAVPPPPVVPPVVIPLGPVIFGQCTAAPARYPQGGGIVTVGSASFSVSAPPGHTLTCQVLGAIDCGTYAWDNYVAVPRRAVRALLSGGIYTGAWQELPGGYTWPAGRATYDISSTAGIALAAGTYTVSIQIDTQEYNQIQVYGGWAQVAVTTV